MWPTDSALCHRIPIANTNIIPIFVCLVSGDEKFRVEIAEMDANSEIRTERVGRAR